MTFDPKSVEVTYVTLSKDHCVQVPWKYIKVCGYNNLFFKNLNQRSLTPKWPLTPHLLRSHAWLYPRIIVSKSHGNTSMYVERVINFAKYHILHVHTPTIQNEWSHDHIVSFWTQVRQAKIHFPTRIFSLSLHHIYIYTYTNHNHISEKEKHKIFVPFQMVAK